MRCSKCGSDNPAGKKFCGDCGTALAASSATAQSPTSPLGTADIAISAEAAASAVAEGERKTVTALFADIKGSTELMAELDPEEARRIIDPALKLMIEAVRRYDGYSAPRRRERRPDGHLKQPCCARDEGRPLEQPTRPWI